ATAAQETGLPGPLPHAGRGSDGVHAGSGVDRFARVSPAAAGGVQGNTQAGGPDPQHRPQARGASHGDRSARGREEAADGEDFQAQG
ncbi:unnamed protein product, partial [Ectocarpus sp. 4 AP-2014]